MWYWSESFASTMRKNLMIVRLIKIQLCYNYKEVGHLSKSCPNCSRWSKIHFVVFLDTNLRTATILLKLRSLLHMMTKRLQKSYSAPLIFLKMCSLPNNIFYGLNDTGSQLTLLKNSSWFKLGESSSTSNNHTLSL